MCEFMAAACAYGQVVLKLGSKWDTKALFCSGLHGHGSGTY